MNTQNAGGLAGSMEPQRKYERAPFGRTSQGQPIFLNPSQVPAKDEYSGGDPYTVRQRLDSGFHQRRFRCTLDLVTLACPPNQGEWRILDLGCGEGHITEAVRQAQPNAQLSGLDCSSTAIDYAASHFPGIDFIVADAYQTPYAPGHFDLVICNNLWEHVPDPLNLLNEVSRVTKPCGKLCVSTPSRYRLENLVAVLRGRPVTFMSQHHVTEYTVGQVKEQLAFGGYTVLKCHSEPIGQNSWKSKLAMRFISAAIRLTGSHHQIESTVFYLAAKKPAAQELIRERPPGGVSPRADEWLPPARQ